MNSRDNYLYNSFLSMLFELDSNHHSSLNDLVLLKDYQKIMSEKMEDEDNSRIGLRYRGLYAHHVNAEKMRRYIEQNVVEYYAINNWDLFVLLKNGDRFVYDSFHNVVDFNMHENDNLTEEQEKKEFAKNLRKELSRRFMTQQELADAIGVNKMTVSRYVNGIQLPDGWTLRRISKVLNCSIDDLFYKKY